MDRINIIVCIQGNSVETWGNMKKLCKVKGFAYDTIIRKKTYPIEYKGAKIYKCQFNPE